MMRVLQTSHWQTSRRSGATGFRASQLGFTLVEMLIALILASIIFTSAYQVISNLVQYRVRAADVNAKKLDRVLMQNMLGQLIGKALHQSDLYFRVQRKNFFSGRSDSVQLISRAYSEHFDDPGYRIYHLSQAGDALRVSYRKYDKEAINSVPVDLDTGFRIEGLQIEYRGDAGWQGQWEDRERIPKLIKVSVTLPGNELFEWIGKTGQG